MIPRFGDRAALLPIPALHQSLPVSLLVLLAVALVGARCRPNPAPLPPLVASDPAPGETGVVRSLWLTLDFAAPVPAGAGQNLVLICEGLGVPVDTYDRGA